MDQLAVRALIPSPYAVLNPLAELQEFPELKQCTSTPVIWCHMSC
jgi:hypothetical protein